MAGKLGEAWWFHEALGRFVTGTYYRKAVPPWLWAAIGAGCLLIVVLLIAAVMML